MRASAGRLFHATRLMPFFGHGRKVWWHTGEIQQIVHDARRFLRDPLGSGIFSAVGPVLFAFSRKSRGHHSRWRDVLAPYTLPDRGFFAYIRYYGPLKAFNEKTWVPNDVALIDQIFPKEFSWRAGSFPGPPVFRGSSTQ